MPKLLSMSMSAEGNILGTPAKSTSERLHRAKSSRRYRTKKSLLLSESTEFYSIPSDDAAYQYSDSSEGSSKRCAKTVHTPPHPSLPNLPIMLETDDLNGAELGSSLSSSSSLDLTAYLSQGSKKVFDVSPSTSCRNEGHKKVLPLLKDCHEPVERDLFTLPSSSTQIELKSGQNTMNSDAIQDDLFRRRFAFAEEGGDQLTSSLQTLTDIAAVPELVKLTTVKKFQRYKTRTFMPQEPPQPSPIRHLPSEGGHNTSGADWHPSMSPEPSSIRTIAPPNMSKSDNNDDNAVIASSAVSEDEATTSGANAKGIPPGPIEVHFKNLDGPVHFQIFKNVTRLVINKLRPVSSSVRWLTLDHISQSAAMTFPRSRYKYLKSVIIENCRLSTVRLPNLMFYLRIDRSIVEITGVEQTDKISITGHKIRQGHPTSNSTFSLSGSSASTGASGVAALNAAIHGLAHVVTAGSSQVSLTQVFIPWFKIPRNAHLRYLELSNCTIKTFEFIKQKLLLSYLCFRNCNFIKSQTHQQINESLIRLRCRKLVAVDTHFGVVQTIFTNSSPYLESASMCFRNNPHAKLQMDLNMKVSSSATMISTSIKPLKWNGTLIDGPIFEKCHTLEVRGACLNNLNDFPQLLNATLDCHLAAHSPPSCLPEKSMAVKLSSWQVLEAFSFYYADHIQTLELFVGSDQWSTNEVIDLRGFTRLKILSIRQLPAVAIIVPLNQLAELNFLNSEAVLLAPEDLDKTHSTETLCLDSTIDPETPSSTTESKHTLQSVHLKSLMIEGLPDHGGNSLDEPSLLRALGFVMDRFLSNQLWGFAQSIETLSLRNFKNKDYHLDLEGCSSLHSLSLEKCELASIRCMPQYLDELVIIDSHCPPSGCCAATRVEISGCRSNESWGNQGRFFDFDYVRDLKIIGWVMAPKLNLNDQFTCLRDVELHRITIPYLTIWNTMETLFLDKVTIEDENVIVDSNNVLRELSWHDVNILVDKQSNYDTVIILNKLASACRLLTHLYVKGIESDVHLDLKWSSVRKLDIQDSMLRSVNER